MFVVCRTVFSLFLVLALVSPALYAVVDALDVIRWGWYFFSVRFRGCYLLDRALMYHSRMLQAAKEISNLNEFVYLAKEISRMLKEEVSWVAATRCYSRHVCPWATES